MIVFWIAAGAWLFAVIVSFANGNVKLPLIILLLGIADILGMIFLQVGWIGLSVLAMMTVILLIANKLDSI